MNHTPTPYTIEDDTDPITIIRQERGCCYGEVIAHCGSAKIPANHRHAAFIVRACNAHDSLVAALERLKCLIRCNLEDRSEYLDGSEYLDSYLQATAALKLARGE